MSAAKNRKDLTGQIFGRLTVIKVAQPGTRKIKLKWLCECECGNLKDIGANELIHGDTKSCGCWRKDAPKIHNKTHGMTKTTTYKTWAHIISRCTNLKHNDYKYYGGRGITVCESWRKFENFLADMGEKPERLEIDRIDNTRGYFKENCRWITHKTNCRNFRRNRLLIFKGQTRTLIEWSELTGLGESAIRHRLKRGWSIEKALTQPLIKGRPSFTYTH